MSLAAAALILLVLALLAACAVSDILRRRIPNRLVVLIALLAVPYWLVTEPHLADRMIEQAGMLAIAIPPLLLLFMTRAWGGGDVKLCAALLLWLPSGEALQAALVMAVTGSVLALLMMLLCRRALGQGVPYGVAIAIAAAIPLTARVAALL
jgi:prepilin peptidase CpaA